MAALRADEAHAAEVRTILGKFPDLAHLSVRRRADVVMLVSGPEHDPVKHARLSRVAVHLWTLEVATHTGRWQPTGMRGHLDQLVDALIADFGWVLTPIA